MTLKALWIATLSLFVLTHSALAQNLLSIRGNVVDATGAAVAGAVIRVENTQGAALSQSETDKSGSFTLQRLPPGASSLIIPAYLGFASQTIPLNLKADINNFKVTLTNESLTQEVSVAADTGISTDPSANRDTVTVNADDLRKLRRFEELDEIVARGPLVLDDERSQERLVQGQAVRAGNGV